MIAGTGEVAAVVTEVLSARDAGLRSCVAVFGSGLNLQAARFDGSPEDDWAGLLARIARELGLSRGAMDALPRPHLFRWEAMLRLWARARAVEPSQAEVQLQQITCVYLRTLEAGSAGRALYREIAQAAFADVISLNFDRRIALSVGRSRFDAGPSPCPHGTHGETLYRHDRIDHGSGRQTRVWYPHGDTKKVSSLKLGVRKYGFYVGTIEESHAGRNESWRFKRGWNQLEKGLPVINPATPRWTGPFLERPLMFIGCGLSFDEWPLWSVLRRRAALRRPPPGYLLVVSPPPTDVAVALADAGVEVLSFPSFDELWGVVRAALLA